MEHLIRFEGAIVEQQAFLDGTRELSIDVEEVGHGGDHPWRLMLSFRCPKDTGPEEGDLSLTAPDGGELYAALTSGVAETMIDEDTDDERLEIDLHFRIESGERAYSGAHGSIRIAGTLTGEDVALAAELSVEVAGDSSQL